MSDVALRFGAKDDGLDAQFRRVNARLEDIERGANKVAESISETFKQIKGLAVVAAISKLAGEVLEFADAVTTAKVQTGLTSDQVQRLMFISSQADVEFGATTGAVLKLQRALGGMEEGSEKSAGALARLGLNNRRFFEQSPEEQFNSVARAVAGLSSQNERVLATTDLLGKSGGELLPVLVAIGTESAVLEAKLDSIGGPVGANAIARVEGLGDEFGATGLSIKSLGTELLAIFSPAIIAGLGKVQLGVAAIRHAVTGPADEAQQLEDRIRELQDLVDNPRGFLQSAPGHISSLRHELRALQLQQEQLQGLGAGGLFNPTIRLSKPAIDLSSELDAIAGLKIGESDEMRADRLKAEEEARQQRIRQIATMMSIEEQMQFDHNLKLDEIDQAKFDRDFQRMVNRQNAELKIRTDGQNFLAAVRRTFGLEEINFEKIKDQSILEIATSMFSQLAGQNTKLAKIQQGIALAQTIWSTSTGIMKAFETLPWPANLAAAAKVALTGAIQVAKIKSTNYAAGSVSGSAPSLTGGGSSIGSARDTVPDTAPATDVRGATNVYISGLITPDIVDMIFDGLRDGFDRDVVIMPANSLQAQVIRGAA